MKPASRSLKHSRALSIKSLHGKMLTQKKVQALFTSLPAAAQRITSLVRDFLFRKSCPLMIWVYSSRASDSSQAKTQKQSQMRFSRSLKTETSFILSSRMSIAILFAGDVRRSLYTALFRHGSSKLRSLSPV